MLEKRNGLRPITAKRYNDILKGYFHCFGQEGSLEEGIGMYAIIELEDGTVTQVDAYQLKFDDAENVSKRPQETTFNHSLDSLDGKISILLQELKIPASLKGYAMLREAIKVVASDYQMLSGVSTRLYPLIAKKYQSTTSRVERAIRHAIETSYQKNYFHPIYQEYFLDYKPTNMQLIAMIADKFRLDEAK
jgi:hypothetical protein